MMTSDLKPYPAYKDSGVEWLGEVPAHWDLRRTKSLLVQRSEKGFPNEPLLAATQTKGVVRKERYENRTVLAMKDLELLKIVRVGDFVISLRSFQGGIEFAREQGIISPAYTILYPFDSDHHAYLAKVFKSHPYIENLSLFVTGIRQGQNIDYERLARSYLPLPPLPEQTAIVRFLDHADRRIRRYIRAKQKLIALLEEQKQAIIHQAVTGQIDVRIGQPYPAYKPSGVESLGDVPAHWAELFLGRCLQRISQGWSPTAAEGAISSDQWAVLTLSSVKRGRFDPTAIKPVPISAEVPEGIEIKDHDLLLTRSNTRELVGDVCIVHGARPKTVMCDLIYRLTPEPTLLDRSFLMFQLLSPLGRRQIQRDARGSSGTMPKIAQRHIRSWKVLIPLLEEQHCIVKIIKKTEKNISNAMKGVQRELSLLQEYRTRLIADVVTGKLDVREAAAELPEVDSLAEDDLDGTIHDEENSSLDELEAAEEVPA